MLIEIVEKALRLIEAPIVVGVSGGPDSMALLHAMVELNLYPIAAHFDHQIRDESKREADFVQEYAESVGIAYRGGSGNVIEFSKAEGMSIEEAGRFLRYQFLFQTADGEGAGGVAVAHHADDQVETILMNLIRGTGMKGLQGMQIVSLPSEWSKSIPLVRPFLSVDKDQVLEYLTDNDVPFLIDPSNSDLIFYRNKIRHELIPQIEQYAPGFKKRLIQTAEIISAESETLDQVADTAWNKCLASQGASYIQLERGKFLENSPAIKRRIIRKALAVLRPEHRDLGYLQVQRALEFLNDPTQKASNWVAKVNLSQSPKRIVFSTWETDLVKDQFPQMLMKKVISCPEDGEYEIGNGWYFSVEPIGFLPEQLDLIEFQKDDFQVWVDRDAFREGLGLRTRGEGDIISPLGMDGKSIKISDLMINEKIPAPYRELWPLVVRADSVLWVPGGRLSHHARITKDTQDICRLVFYRKGS